MTTVVPRILSVRCARHSPRPPIPLLMCAWRTSLLAAVSQAPQHQRPHLTYLVSDTQQNPVREIELDVEIGADARDWSSIQAQEKLKPIETDLRRIEEMVADIVTEMDYLRAREQRLRDTNESTNERVKWFAFGTMGMLVGLGAWQVVYLRAYFRSKHLI